MLGLVALAPLALAAQDRPDSAQMARVMELAQPGPEHRRLAALAGTWNVTFTTPMQEMTFTAVAENTITMGGRFLESRVRGAVGGMPFEALTIVGFDRGPAVYTAVGFDASGTFYVTGAGPWDDRVNGANLSGTYDDPATGHAHTYEFEWRVHSTDHYSWAVVFLEGGRRSTVMRGDYRRH
ncbi:MAG: DUF1579 family protein [Gemmatimonadales bacterium]